MADIQRDPRALLLSLRLHYQAVEPNCINYDQNLDGLFIDLAKYMDKVIDCAINTLAIPENTSFSVNNLAIYQYNKNSLKKAINKQPYSDAYKQLYPRNIPADRRDIDRLSWKDLKVTSTLRHSLKEIGYLNLSGNSTSNLVNKDTSLNLSHYNKEFKNAFYLELGDTKEWANVAVSPEQAQDEL